MSKIKFFKNALIYGAVPRLSSIASLFTIPLLTPCLTKTDYGHWGLICSYVSIFTMVSTFGLHANLTNTYFEFKHPRFRLIWSRLFCLMLIGSISSSLISSVILYVTLNDLPPITRSIAATLSVVPILFYPLQLVAEHYFVVTEQPTPLVIRNLGSSLVNIAVSFVAIKSFNLGFLGWVMGGAAGSIILACSYFRPICLSLGVRPVWERSKRRRTKYLKISLPIVPHSLGHALLANSDKVVLGLLAVTISDIGTYSNGYQMGTIISPIAGGLAAAIAPSIHKFYRLNEIGKFRELFRVTHVAVQLLVFLTALWMPEIYRILVRNHSLHEAIPVAILASYTFSTSIIYCFFAAIITIQKKYVKILWLVFAPAAINVLLNLLLVPTFGFVAAATTTVIAQLTICVLPILNPYYKQEIKKYIGSEIHLVYLTPPITAVSMSAVYFLFFKFSIGMKITLCIPAILIFFLSVDNKDWRDRGNRLLHLTRQRIFFSRSGN